MRSDRACARHSAGATRVRPGRAAPPEAFGSNLSPAAFGIACGVAGVAVLTVVLLSGTGALGAEASQVVDNLGQFLGGAAATVCAWLTWRRAAPGDRTWRLLLALGMFGWTCGLTLWAWYQIFTGNSLPSPSLADVGFFALPLFALPALWTFPAQTFTAPGDDLPRLCDGPGDRHLRFRAIFVVDGLVVVGSLFLLTWSTALGAALKAEAPSLPAFLVALGYPVTDWLLFVFVVLFATFRQPQNPLALLLLGFGLISFSISDSLFLYLVSTGAESMPPLYNIGFVLGPTLLALCMLVPHPPSHRPQADTQTVQVERRAVLLPYVPLTLTGLLVVGQLLSGARIDRVEGGIGFLLIAIVVVRQLVTLLDNVNLLHQVREGEHQLRRQAFHDPLTDLANRALFRDRLDHAVDLHRGDRRPLALLFCDLDDFKVVNDRFGHAAGDELLQVVADRLRACVTDADTVARLGGDEFAVLLEGEDPAATVGDRVLAALERPFVLGARGRDPGASVRVGASVGLVVMDPTEIGIGPDWLLARADAAMYEAKRSGKSRLVNFRRELAPGPETSSLLGDLRRALEPATANGSANGGSDGALDGASNGALNGHGNGAGSAVTGSGEGAHGNGARDGARGAAGDRGVDVVYQPVVRIADSAVVALEALVRWRHPLHGSMPADVLVSAADDAGMLAELEERVLDTACRDAGRLRTSAMPGIPAELAVHVNVSAQRTMDTHLVESVAAALDRHGLPGRALVLEITETNRMPDLDAAAAVLQQLRELGVRLALDDFGAGFSGLTYLLRLPIDIVKLDRTLTTAEPETRAATIRRAAASLTRGLGLDLIAEGVETSVQARQLTGLGCDLAQGFLFARPALLPDLGFETLPTPAARPRTQG